MWIALLLESFFVKNNNQINKGFLSGNIFSSSQRM